MFKDSRLGYVVVLLVNIFVVDCNQGVSRFSESKVASTQELLATIELTPSTKPTSTRKPTNTLKPNNMLAQQLAISLFVRENGR